MKDESRAWLLGLQEYFISKVEPVPKGWLTIEMISKILKKHDCATRKYVHHLVNIKSAEKRSFKILSGKRVMTICHYKLK